MKTGVLGPHTLIDPHTFEYYMKEVCEEYELVITEIVTSDEVGTARLARSFAEKHGFYCHKKIPIDYKLYDDKARSMMGALMIKNTNQIIVFHNGFENRNKNIVRMAQERGRDAYLVNYINGNIGKV